MSDQQLFCVADDQHRAVLLVGALADLGYPVVQVHEPGVEVEEPALVLWTRRASEAGWIRDLFTAHPQLVALVIDDVPVPIACKRAVALQNWPARSADSNISALVGWLQNPAGAASPFIQATKSRSDRDPGSGIALGILVLVVVLLFGLLLSSNSDETVSSEIVSQDLPAATGTRTTRQAPAITEDRTRSGSATAAVSSRSGAVLAVMTPETVVVAGESTGSVPPLTLPAGDRVDATASAQGDDSLSHLCRARSLAAAIAWYRVLTREQRQRAPDLECVRALLQQPGFELLREEIQA